MKVSERLPKIGEEVIWEHPSGNIKCIVSKWPDASTNALCWKYRLDDGRTFCKIMYDFDSYQPERLNPEDTSDSVCDSLNNGGSR